MISDLFVGRKDELERINALFHKSTSSLVVLKGRRRIGKSRLVHEFAKGRRFLKFSGVPPLNDITQQKQRDIFASQLRQQIPGPGLKAENWYELFVYLSEQITSEQTVILLDEISWMGSKDPTFLGTLKNAWDMHFSQHPNLIVVICGSVSTWIQENIVKSTGFFGRISLLLHLEELSLKECSTYLDQRGFRGSAHEKMKLLSVLGGIPWYLEQIQPKIAADDNIRNLCFRKNALLVNEFDLIFHDLFARRNETYKKIIEVLAKQNSGLQEIRDEIGFAKSGVLSDYIENLMEAGFVSRNYTWRLKTGEESSRVSHFRLSDNYIRFYIRYILPQLSKIERDEFSQTSPFLLSGWDSMMGLQFENLVLKNRRIVRDLLNIRPETVVIDNPYFQRSTSVHSGVQIDYLIQTRHNVLFVCEIKFSRREISKSVIADMQEKIKKLTVPRGMAICPVLIHINGVEDSVIESGYFTDIIDFSSLL